MFYLLWDLGDVLQAVIRNLLFLLPLTFSFMRLQVEGEPAGASEDLLALRTLKQPLTYCFSLFHLGFVVPYYLKEKEIQG